LSDIFVSYARHDRPNAERLVKALRQRGWSVWWDTQLRAGDIFDEVIQAALGNAKCCLVLWSKNSVKSRWVRAEANEASRKDVLVPVLLEDVDIPLMFSMMQTANLVGWSGTLPSAQFDELAEAVAAVLSHTVNTEAKPRHAQPDARSVTSTSSPSEL